MISVEEARRAARERLASKAAAWVIEPPGFPAFAVSLKPPSEREVLADQAVAESWVRAWTAANVPRGTEVDWEVRDWPRVGRQRIPVRLRFVDASAVATYAGGAPARDWAALSARVTRLRELFGPSPALDVAVRRHRSHLLSWTPERFDQVAQVVRWLVLNPAHGLRPRQVPIRGVDTKWLAAHRSVVTDLYAAATGTSDLGLVDADRMVRVRILDDGLAIGGLRELSAPASELAMLALEPHTVAVFENLESVLALPPWPGVVAIHGSGYAVDVVGDLPWVRSTRVVYWGDLDSHGFAILHRLRTHLPHVASTLMDEATLLEHRDLWVPEPKPARGHFPTLTASEGAALERLRSEGDVRLEQERIPWVTALRHLEIAVRPSA